MPIIKGPRALALHLRKVLLECGVHGPWIVRKADAVSRCGGQWCVDVILKNTETGANAFAIIGVGGVASHHIHIAGEDPTLSIVREMVCDCLAATGVEPSVLCGKRRA